VQLTFQFELLAHLRTTLQILLSLLVVDMSVQLVFSLNVSLTSRQSSSILVVVSMFSHVTAVLLHTIVRENFDTMLAVSLSSAGGMVLAQTVSMMMLVQPAPYVEQIIESSHIEILFMRWTVALNLQQSVRMEMVDVMEREVREVLEEHVALDVLLQHRLCSYGLV
jgi:hypothetical protein